MDWIVDLSLQKSIRRRSEGDLPTEEENSAKELLLWGNIPKINIFRTIVAAVAGSAPYEKRIIELLKTGQAKD